MNAHAAIDIRLCGQGIGLQLRKLLLEILETSAPRRERRLGGHLGALDLRDAVGQKAILHVGGRKALGGLELRKRAFVKFPLAGTRLDVHLGELALCLLVQIVNLVGVGLLALELGGELVELGNRVPVLGLVGLETGGDVNATRLGTMDGLA